MKLLIIEDEESLRESMVQYLESQQYVCESATNYTTAIEKLDSYDYDCILLDITLPDGNGLNLLQVIKKDGKQDGIIIISAKNALDDKIAGLQLGADDYLAKPFHLAELSARISAVIRRRQFSGNDIIILDELKINVPLREAYVNNHAVELTRKEFDLLLFFVTNKNRVVSKQAIVTHLSGDDAYWFDNFDIVYAHIKNLKKKLTDAGCQDHIHSVYGVGYKFIVQ